MVTMVSPEEAEQTKGVVIGGRNLVTNPKLQTNTNSWSISGAITTEIKGLRTRLTGDGYFYQTMNPYDVANGTEYTLRVKVYAQSGTTTCTVGSAYNDSSLGTLTLAVGWNTVKFTAGSVTVVSIHSSGSSDYVETSIIEVREQADLSVTGDLISGGGALYLSNVWKITTSTTGISFQHLESGVWVERGSIEA